jgi:5-methylcytosine-specific restriction endonuclease McrA
MADETIPQSRPVVTRAEAKAAGLKRYFTGKACKRGHVAERLLSTGVCLECSRQWDRAWFAANPDKAHAKAKKRYAADPEAMKDKSKAWARLHPEANRKYISTHKERLNEKRRDRRAANPEITRSQKQAHRLSNLEKYRERERRVAERFREKNIKRALLWAKNNPNGVRAQQALRRARHNKAPGRHTAKDIREIYEQQGGMCFYCFEPLPQDFAVDHFYPLSRGGSNWPENLRGACKRCNNRKYNRDPVEFMTNDKVCRDASAFPRFQFRLA